MSSLSDQLKKAGLVEENKVKKAKKAKHKKSVVQRHNKAELVDEHKQAAEQARAEKAERDRQLNLEKKAEAERKAVVAQIRQLIDSNRLNEIEGEVAYNFSDAGVVKKLFVTDVLQRDISRGYLAIVQSEGAYALVPAAVARKIKERDEQTVVVLNDNKDAADDDDPYAEFQVPDDLMW